jgi:hypothetical protein
MNFRSNLYGRTSCSSSQRRLSGLSPSRFLRRSWSSTKAIYFFIRYVPVMVEVYVHSFLTDPFCSFIVLGVSRSILLIGTELTPPFHFTPHDCYIWQVYQAVALSLILTAIDFILILRGQSNKVIYSHLHFKSY